MSRIFLAGHGGMVGSAILRRLVARGDHEILVRSHAELDLTDQSAVARFMQAERPDLVILAAARVGGILANNSFPADFINDNLLIACNVIGQAYAAGVRRLLQLGSSCIYPRDAPQPMKEEALLTGPLEPTNEPYAVAKIAAIKLCESFNRQHGTDYRSVMPTNLYGPGDNFHPNDSHVLPALMLRFDEARRHSRDEVEIWGSGKQLREFLHVDDLAEAAIFVLDLPKPVYDSNTRPMLSHINVGSGEEVSVLDLARSVAAAVGYSGRIVTDTTKPEGTPRKLLDSSRLRSLGWMPRISLEKGLAATYQWFVAHRAGLRL